MRTKKRKVSLEGFPLAIAVIQRAENVHQSGAVYFDIKNAKGNAWRLFANRMVSRID